MKSSCIRFGGRLLLFAIYILMNGCQSNTLRPTELLQHIRDPRYGLVQSVERVPWEMQIQYKPPVVMALSSLEGGTNAPDFEHAYQNSTGFWDFDLLIRPIDQRPVDEILTHSEDSLEAIRNYLAFGLQKGISLWVNGDSIPCTFYHLLPIGKIDNAYHAMISFERPQSVLDWRQDLLLTLYEPLLSPHPIQFRWNKNDLDNLPKLDNIQ